VKPLASEKGRISRRRFVKYFVGLGAALAAAAVGFRLVTRRGAEEATRTTLPPAETTEAPKTTKPTPQTTEPPKPPSGEGFADMILMNGNILTVDPNDRVVNAVAVKEEKIQATGSYEDLKHFVGSSTKNIDLQGKTVTPGLVDSHIHVHYYGKQFQDNLVNIRYPIVKTKGDLVGKIRERLKLVGEGKWVAGNQGFFIANPPDRLELDEMAPVNPVFLLHSSGQFAVANSQALKLAGISRDTPNPYGGHIQKDLSTGEPTGFLYHYPAIDMVRRLIPGIGQVTEQEEKEFILVGVRKCFEQGYTSCQDVIISSLDDVQLYIELAKEGKLPLDIYMLLYVQSLKDAENKLKMADHWKGKKYNFAGWKLALDGGGAAGTLLMYDKDTPASQRSYLYHTQETLNEMVAMLHKDGYQVAFHVGGDKAIDMALDAIEYALKKYPREDHRHRLEHALLPTYEAMDRIKKLGVIVSTQPQWITHHGEGWKKIFKQEQLERFMPLKTMLKKGIHLAFGCDVPATIFIEPKYALIGATSRMTFERGFVTPEEAISMRDALRAHTMGSAYAAFEENVRGSIEPGKTADMVVWSEDLYSAPLVKLWNIKVEATIVEGEVVYKANDTSLRL
jgi:predicted amidohydrolase YtcJ